MVSELDFKNTLVKQMLWMEAGLTRCIICFRLTLNDLEWEVPCCDKCRQRAMESVS